ncbi:hypothetical protein FQR65_LT07596 [Abscondita terminalis]|nr:hypothetical protein FQR65_LT07596 [Abscondita terminalis]
MQVSKEELHTQVSSIHEVYRNYARMKVDHNLLQRKYKSCLLTLKTTRVENQTLKENSKDIYVEKHVHDGVVKEREELQRQYDSLKVEFNDSVNRVQISYQSTCQALNDLQSDYKSVVSKCEALTNQNRLLESKTVKVNEQLKEENEVLTKELDKCKKNNVKTVKENERLRLSVQNQVELQKKYDKLLSSNHDFTSECDQLRRQVQFLDGTVQKMKQSELDHEKKLSRVTEQNECLLSKLSSLDCKYSEVVEQRNSLEIEVRRLEMQLKRVKCDTFQKKDDNSCRNCTTILMDVRQLLEKHEKVDTEATEEKFCCDFVQKDECEDTIACSDVNAVTHLKPITDKLLTQENRDCQVINNEFKIKELISDSPTLEQSIQDENFSEDDEMLKLIFESTKFTVTLLSPIASPILEEPELLSIPDVGDSSNILDLVEKDMLIGEHQSSWISDKALSIASDLKFMSTNISDEQVIVPINEQHTMTVTVEASNAEFATESETMGSLDSTFSAKDEETSIIIDNIDNKDSTVTTSDKAMVSCPKTNNFDLISTNKSKELDNVIATDDESIQLPIINPDLDSIKNQSNKKLKILNDFDNVDSAFGSLCSSDEELITAEQYKISKLDDDTSNEPL